MTKERFEQYADLRCEVAHLELKLNALIAEGPQAAADTVQTAAEFPYSLHIIPVKGFDWGAYEARRARIAEKLANQKAALLMEREAVEDFIAEIPNSRIRQIISLRYIDGWSWRRIAYKLNYRTPSAPRNRIDRFFSKNT